MRCTDEQTCESKVIMQWVCENNHRGMYRQEIDMINIQTDNAIVRLINALNQEVIDIEEEIVVQVGREQHQAMQQKTIRKVVLKQ